VILLQELAEITMSNKLTAKHVLGWRHMPLSMSLSFRDRHLQMMPTQLLSHLLISASTICTCRQLS